MTLPDQNKSVLNNRHWDKTRIALIGMAQYFSLMLLPLMLTSCEAIADVFRAGMSVGIFIVVVIIIAIVVFMMRIRKNSD